MRKGKETRIELVILQHTPKLNELESAMMDVGVEEKDKNGKQQQSVGMRWLIRPGSYFACDGS